jgi:hypothetical protein
VLVTGKEKGQKLHTSFILNIMVTTGKKRDKEMDYLHVHSLTKYVLELFAD